MDFTLFQSEPIYKIIVNTLLVSIPEEVYFVLFIYIMMGEFDQWLDKDCKKLFYPWDYSRILIPAAVAGLFSNILRFSGAGTELIASGTLLAIFFGIVAMGDLTNNARALQWVGKVFVFLLLAAICDGIIDLTYYPFLLHSTGFTFDELIKNHFFIGILTTLPARIMEYSLLAFLIVHKRSLLKARILKIIFESKFLTFFSFITLFTNVCIIVFMYKVIYFEKALDLLPSELRLGVILATVLFPIINVSAVVWCPYYIKERETASKKANSDSIMNIIEQIKTYTKNGAPENSVWTLHGLAADLEAIAGSLYHDEKSGKK